MKKRVIRGLEIGLIVLISFFIVQNRVTYQRIKQGDFYTKAIYLMYDTRLDLANLVSKIDDTDVTYQRDLDLLAIETPGFSLGTTSDPVGLNKTESKLLILNYEYEGIHFRTQIDKSGDEENEITYSKTCYYAYLVDGKYAIENGEELEALIGIKQTEIIDAMQAGRDNAEALVDELCGQVALDLNTMLVLGIVLVFTVILLICFPGKSVNYGY